ncbi:uncharacterized protein LOC127529773 [Erpetoichthys calabaricus]|uniref:uncharacterized protein LOC127529773 n=1 Tax=Erpetoichthys calabaricus TaxID=27687 RepID=UPI0022342FDE|nr:uncharacterized protein LOC127529773 [Erpetoichthys calabaricus]
MRSRIQRSFMSVPWSTNNVLHNMSKVNQTAVVTSVAHVDDFSSSLIALLVVLTLALTILGLSLVTFHCHKSKLRDRKLKKAQQEYEKDVKRHRAHAQKRLQKILAASAHSRGNVRVGLPKKGQVHRIHEVQAIEIAEGLKEARAQKSKAGPTASKAEKTLSSFVKRNCQDTLTGLTESGSQVTLEYSGGRIQQKPLGGLKWSGSHKLGKTAQSRPLETVGEQAEHVSQKAVGGLKESKTLTEKRPHEAQVSQKWSNPMVIFGKPIDRRKQEPLHSTIKGTSPKKVEDLAEGSNQKAKQVVQESSAEIQDNSQTVQRP